ncbi:hypothetical protein LY76DRAFT_688037 [Colletotrichum caudatum]|nr:hypothetical protein LY76DRAFT_688037 [Colletotrichum caudatum]
MRTQSPLSRPPCPFKARHDTGRGAGSARMHGRPRLRSLTTLGFLCLVLLFPLLTHGNEAWGADVGLAWPRRATRHLTRQTVVRTAQLYDKTLLFG